MKNINLSFAVLLGASLMIAGCTSTKQSLGITKKAPDEFSVVRRAPLSMPPDYTLRPPTPGSVRPQELNTSDVARTQVFGGQANSAARGVSQSDNAFLTQAGANVADPDIRTKIDTEKNSVQKDKRPIGQRIFGIGSKDSGAAVVDAKAEAQRIIDNKESGYPIGSGETPMR